MRPGLRRALPALVAALSLPAMAATADLVGGTPTASAFSREGLPVEYLDGLRAQDDFNGWDVNTPAFEWFDRSGVDVVMPVVGLSMAGGAGPILSAYHPTQFGYAASLSGFLNPSTPFMKQAIRVAMFDACGYDVDDMWGRPWDPAWKHNDPVLQVDRIVANRTRLWIYCAPGGGPLDESVDPGQSFNANSLESLAVNGNKRFQERYAKAGGSNATFVFPSEGNHSWAYWGQQLQALKPDLIATLNG